MADDIDPQNEDFEITAMKPIAGEEIGGLWGRQMAGNAGHLFYAMPPIFEIDLPFFATSGIYKTVAKRLHFGTYAKSGYVTKWKMYYWLPEDLDSATVIVDGTTVFATTSNSKYDVESNLEFGASGLNEMVAVAVYATQTPGLTVGFYRPIKFIMYPDWDNM